MEMVLGGSACVVFVAQVKAHSDRSTYVLGTISRTLSRPEGRRSTTKLCGRMRACMLGG